jgi:hypothetical protein
MAEPLPDQPVGDWQINTPLSISPWSSLWWTTGAITNIPPDSVGWMLAQGWEITGVSYDTTTTPATPFYSMTKEVLNSATVLQHLLNDFTIKDNDAKWATELRYNLVVQHWAGLMQSTEAYLDTQAAEQAGHVTIYLNNLDTYMNEVDTLIDANETDYSTHVPTATGFLTGLGATETARINEKFTASLATQLQQLTDRGLYSSGVATDITARNTRDWNEELVALNDRLNREQWENQHRLYEQQFRMKEQTIVQKMNESAARLAGLANKHAEDMQLMKYMLSERNQLLVGLYGFVERRDDVPPQWENLAQIVAGLGDAGGGWISP